MIERGFKLNRSKNFGVIQNDGTIIIGNLTIKHDEISKKTKIFYGENLIYDNKKKKVAIDFLTKNLNPITSKNFDDCDRESRGKILDIVDLLSCIRDFNNSFDDLKSHISYILDDNIIIAFADIEKLLSPYIRAIDENGIDELIGFVGPDDPILESPYFNSQYIPYAEYKPKIANPDDIIKNKENTLKVLAAEGIISWQDKNKKPQSSLTLEKLKDAISALLEQGKINYPEKGKEYDFIKDNIYSGDNKPFSRNAIYTAKSRKKKKSSRGVQETSFNLSP
jgi:hypothetical protein